MNYGSALKKALITKTLSTRFRQLVDSGGVESSAGLGGPRTRSLDSRCDHSDVKKSCEKPVQAAKSLVSD